MPNWGCVCGGLALSNGVGRGRELTEVGPGLKATRLELPPAQGETMVEGARAGGPKWSRGSPSPLINHNPRLKLQRVPAPPWRRRKWAAAPGGAPLPALCPGCNAPSQKAGWRAGWAPPPRGVGLGGQERPRFMQPPFAPLPGRGPDHGLSLPSLGCARPHPSLSLRV